MALLLQFTMRATAEMHLRERTPHQLYSYRALFRHWHNSEEPLTDDVINSALGLSEWDFERILDPTEVRPFTGERVEYDPIPYEVVRKLIRVLRPSKTDIFYDLGAGYGRVIFYGALVSQGIFRGIEIVPARVREAERIKDALGLERAQFRQGDAKDAEYSDGTMFFFFNPFVLHTMEVVVGRLKRISEDHRIQIASVAGSNRYLARESWLRNVHASFNEPPGTPHYLRFFESI